MEWKNYIVGLVDILGQRSKLEELGLLWWEIQGSNNVTKEKYDRTKKLKEEIFEEVNYFRNLFSKSFNIFKELILNNSKSSTLSIIEQDKIEKIANSICTLRFFLI